MVVDVESVALVIVTIPEVIVLSKISPLDISSIIESVQKSKRIVVVEEGSKEFGIGSEVIAQVLSHSKPHGFFQLERSFQY